MEDRLKKLVEGNSEANRYQKALEWKRRGGKVIGILDSYVPEEIIYAAGILPWRITGSWGAAVPLARGYRPSQSHCLFCDSVAESLLAGEFDFLDGVVAAGRDQELVRVWDLWVSLGNMPLIEIVSLPFHESELGYRQFAQELSGLIKALETFTGAKIDDESLRAAIRIYGKTRSLLSGVYDLRKRSIPPLSGAEILGITTTAQVMPKDEFNSELEALLPYLERREALLRNVTPRLLVSSTMLDNPAYLELVEDAGCLVAMDNLDTGSRWVWMKIDDSLEDPVYSLAKSYLARPGCPNMFHWDKQVQQVIDWCGEFGIDGVLQLIQMRCRPEEMRVPYFRDTLERAGIANMSFRRDYHFAGAGQLRTRVGAFLEMLDSGG